jgi:sugar/nucleoside kinase (ribokinase family)
VDGHHQELCRAALSAARLFGKTTILDGGSWKPGTEDLLPDVDVALCSADFHAPGAATPAETLAFLQAKGVTWAAITQGPDPVLWSGPHGQGQVVVPQARVVDTLGAGDVFHGACAFAIAVVDVLDEAAFVDALQKAAAVAATSCGSFGTRSWMTRVGPGADM